MSDEVVVWLVGDTLRLADNPTLILACEQAVQREASLVPVVCLEPRRWADQQFGLPRIAPHWTRFRVESVRALDADLQARCDSLWILQTSGSCVSVIRHPSSDVCVSTHTLTESAEHANSIEDSVLS
jgi:Deoxyribodipyrimidine photolyase